WADAGEKPKEAKEAKSDKVRPSAKGQIAISGRVLNPDGKPAGGAQVAVLTFPKDFGMIRSELDIRFEVLGQAQADGMGRFRRKVPRRAAPQLAALPLQTGQMMVTGKGYALTLRSLDLNADKAEAVIRLKKERVFRGRVLDLQGDPVKGLKLHLVAVAEKA